MIRKNVLVMLALLEIAAKISFVQIIAPVPKMANVLLRMCVSAKTPLQDRIVARLLSRQSMRLRPVVLTEVCTSFLL